MKRIIGSRATGKSTELLKMALRDNADIAVWSHAANHFALIAREIGIPKEQIKFITDGVVIRDVVVAPIYKFLYASDGIFAQHKNLYIDELDLCLNALSFKSTHTIAGYTISLEDTE